MADNKKSERELEHIAEQTREVFQDLLKAHIKDKAEIEQLAKALGKTTSLVKKMLYKGNGGLDVWAKALAYVYGLSEQTLAGFKEEFRRKNPVSPSDKVWFSIREEMGASEDDLRYLAECAREAFRIKTDLEGIKKRRSK